MIALRPSKRPPVSKVNWRLIMHFNEHETWRGMCPEIKIFDDYGDGKAYYPDYLKIVVRGQKPKYFYGEMATINANRYLFDLGADSTI